MDDATMNAADPSPRDVTIASADGTVLRGWYWGRPAPRGILAIVHGFGEHGGCYGHVAEVLGPALDVDVVAADLRGHGRSAGRRGVIRSFDELVDDVRAVRDWAAAQRPGLPLYLLGHSNGGLLVILLTLRDAPINGNPGPIASGLILSNPALQVVSPVARSKILAGRILRRYAPGVTLPARLDPSLLTRDPLMQQSRLGDTLRHSRMSAPLFFGMVESGAAAVRGVSAITLPTLFLLSGSDPVIDPETSRRAFERISSTDKALKVYPEMRHEPFNELGREAVFDDIQGWLRPRLGV
jgi:alpha-beta hydrolase superfamily lysophospholipase